MYIGKSMGVVSPTSACAYALYWQVAFGPAIKVIALTTSCRSQGASL